MNLGERLIQLRKENSYTREDLADILGISKYTLRNYELGVTEPGHPFLIKVADLFNASIDYIMGLTDERERVSLYNLKSSEYEHIKKYRNLDSHGKEMVDFTLEKEYERSIALNEQNNNIVQIPIHLETKAAHERTDIEVTEDMIKHDDDVMEDENF